MEVPKEKKSAFVVCFFRPRIIFLTFVVFYLNAKCIEKTFTIYIYLYISKTLLHTLLLLIFKIIECLRCILKIFAIFTSKRLCWSLFLINLIGFYTTWLAILVITELTNRINILYGRALGLFCLDFWTSFCKLLQMNEQKQPSRGILRKSCSENMQQIYRLQSNFIEIALWHGCSPVNFLHICKTSFDRKTSGRLLLNGSMKNTSAYWSVPIWLANIDLYYVKQSNNIWNH